jgi:hypothetical protein
MTPKEEVKDDVIFVLVFDLPGNTKASLNCILGR